MILQSVGYFSDPALYECRYNERNERIMLLPGNNGECAQAMTVPKDFRFPYSIKDSDPTQCINLTNKAINKPDETVFSYVKIEKSKFTNSVSESYAFVFCQFCENSNETISDEIDNIQGIVFNDKGYLSNYISVPLPPPKIFS
jgi:hypothetical protein